MFLGLFICLLFGFSYLIVSVVYFVIRLFKPQFGELIVVETQDAKAEGREVKKVAIDFVMAHRLKQQNDRKRRIEELLNSTIGKPANELSWTLESLRTEVQAKPRSAVEPEDLWQICRMEQGRRRYLAVWRSTRDGLKTGWSPSSKYGIRTSAEAGLRWISMLPGAFLAPCNAASRQKIRNEALKIREESNAATA
jgi:hypothetical protein